MHDRTPRLYQRLLLLADIAGALLAFALLSLAVPLAPLSWGLVGSAVVAMVLGIWSLRGYQLQRVFRIADEVAVVAMGGLVGMGIFGGSLFFLQRPFPRSAALLFAALTVVLALPLRIAAREAFKRREAPRLPRSRVLVVGAGESGEAVRAELHEREWLGIEVVAVVGGAAPLEALCREQRADVVVVALPLDGNPALTRALERLSRLPVEVKLLPDLYPLAHFANRIEMFGGMAMVSLSEPAIAPWQAAVKRAMDVAVSLPALLLAALPMLAIGLAVRLSSEGPIFYPQERVGAGGRLFRMWKFRTMVQGAEAALLAEAEVDPTLLIKQADDPRVTAVGRWLRRFSLDELPQLWNVLRGDMSLVGPRPELPYLVERYEPWQRKRLLVPQGMTGWWQINGRSDKPMLLHTEDDLYYIRNYSLLLDLEILWKTIWVVVRGRGAY